MTENEQTDAAALAAIRERVDALPDEPTFLKWNYSEYGMIRGVYTEAQIANVFTKPYDKFYQSAPADIRLLLAALAEAEARAGRYQAQRDAALAIATRLDYDIEMEGYPADPELAILRRANRSRRRPRAAGDACGRAGG